jgi:hypothetical protein
LVVSNGGPGDNLVLLKNPFVQTISFPAIGDITVTNSVQLQATGGASNNPVIFTTSTPSICATSGVDGSTLTTVAIGTCVVVANQAGTSNEMFDPAVATQDINVTAMKQAIYFNAMVDKVSLASAFITMSAGGSSPAPIYFSVTTPKVCAISGGDNAKVILLAPGTCTVEANAPAYGNFSAAPTVQQSFTVTAVGVVQRPAHGCVKIGNKTSIPRHGTRVLMAAGCATSAHRHIAARIDMLKLRATTRGDTRLATLYCQVSASQIAATVSARTGRGYRECSKGAMKIRTYGYKLELELHWHAAPSTMHAAFDRTQRYVV